ncbi:MAG: 30S ribosomal protein S16 [Candidatus Saccharimonadales bacterium]
MLAIRMQRTGRKRHAMFRVVVQDSRRTPTSGKVAARLGSYDPHAKIATLDKEKATFYLKNGAQPSERVARLLKAEGVKLPKWVVVASKQKRAARNPDKRRSTRPPEAAAPKDEASAEPTKAVDEDASEVKEEAPEAEKAPELAEAESEPQADQATESKEK